MAQVQENDRRQGEIQYSPSTISLSRGKELIFIQRVLYQSTACSWYQNELLWAMKRARINDKKINDKWALLQWINFNIGVLVKTEPTEHFPTFVLAAWKPSPFSLSGPINSLHPPFIFPININNFKGTILKSSNSKAVNCQTINGSHGDDMVIKKSTGSMCASRVVFELGL